VSRSIECTEDGGRTISKATWGWRGLRHIALLSAGRTVWASWIGLSCATRFIASFAQMPAGEEQKESGDNQMMTTDLNNLGVDKVGCRLRSSACWEGFPSWRYSVLSIVALRCDGWIRCNPNLSSYGEVVHVGSFASVPLCFCFEWAM
jgi:hypothetical protein